MRIIPASARPDDWADLRAELFPDDDAADHRAVLEVANRAGFLALDDIGSAQGFAEASVRHDYVNGLDDTPAAFLEALYVREGHRRSGTARMLVAAVEDWARRLGLSELGSDAPLDNTASHAVHQALGFEETERVVCFRRAL